MGQLYILDLTKRGVDIDKAARGKGRDRISAHTVRTWNALPGQDHPKDAKGRWTSGHPSVGLMGDLPDVVGRLSDDDLKRADAHANSLIAALTAEKGRRGVAAMAAAQKAKPLKATRPTKPVPPAVAERVAAIQKRPIPSDVAFLEAELPKLTMAQLDTLNPYDDLKLSGSKAERVRELRSRLTGVLSHEAITHGTHDRAFDPLGKNSEDRARQEEFKRRKKLADERGDREEYAALMAGFGIAGTGPGLPPEKGAAPALKLTPDERITKTDPYTMNEGTDAEKRRLAREARAAEKAKSPEKGEKTISQALFGDEPLMGSKEWLAQREKPAPAAKPLKATKPGADDARIAAMIAKPKSGDREELKAMLMGLTLPQIKGVAERHADGILLGSRKEDKVNSLVERLIGGQLNSEAIRSGIDSSSASARRVQIAAVLRKFQGDQEGMAAELKNWKLSAAELKDLAYELNVDIPSAAKTKAARERYLTTTLAEHSRRTGGYGGAQREVREASERTKVAEKAIPGIAALERKKAKLRTQMDAAESRSRESGRMTQSDREAELHNEMRRVEDEIRALKQGAKANLERLAGGPLSDFAGPRYLDTPRKVQGSGNFFEGHFHPDGRMGTAWQGLSARQASEDIGGMRLDDALAEAIRMGYDGQPGRIGEQMIRFQEIISKVRDPKVKGDLQYAFDRLKPQNVPNLTAKELDDAPEPLMALLRHLSTIPDTGQGGGEAARLVDILRRWSSGELRAGMLEIEVHHLSGLRHESQEGYHEMARAVDKAAERIRAMRRDLKRPGS